MKLFRTLRQQLGFEKDPLQQQLFGLSNEEVAELRSLRASEGWRVYAKLLDVSVSLYGEALLAARDDAGLREARGHILGLRKAAHLVDETLQHADELGRDTERKRNEQRRNDANTHALWGSPGFGRTVSK